MKAGDFRKEVAIEINLPRPIENYIVGVFFVALLYLRMQFVKWVLHSH